MQKLSVCEGSVVALPAAVAAGILNFDMSELILNSNYYKFTITADLEEIISIP